ncbi:MULTISPECIES: hypothetical protein [unclassified Mesorhizobium]|uniref:hypothetical protein n=1 Tax=unclassified Mesorhizobium TaxID=325217 RepID=UPI001FEF6BA3|nr:MULTISPECIES: hypothetical protein [unclassified Mesorhizobium]
MNSVLRHLVIAAACTFGAGAVYALAEGGGDLVVFDWSGHEDPLLHPAYTTISTSSSTRPCSSSRYRRS